MNIAKKLKKAVIGLIVLSTCISQFNILGNAYALELDKIQDKSNYGEYYNQDINHNVTESLVVETGNPAIITKEPVVTDTDIKRTNAEEREELRSDHSKTYELNDGSYVTDFYFTPIHKVEDGEYVEIDNDLVANTSSRSLSTYTNKDGLYNFTIVSGQLVIENPNGDVLNIVPNGNLGNYAIKENVILYSEVSKNVDLEYRVEANSVSQNIYINGELEENSYSIDIDNSNHYEMIKNEDGSLDFIKNNDVAFALIAPYLIDKDGNRNQNVRYEITENENESTITITLVFDEEWIEEDERVYPITARATVAIGNIDVVDLSSSYIRSNWPSTTSQYSDLFVGYDNNYYAYGASLGVTRTFIYFEMPDIGENQTIVSASLQLYKEQDMAPNELNDIDIYHVDYVNPATVTWSNQPSNASKTWVSNTKFTKPIGYKAFDITTHVQALLDGQKKTLVLQVVDESSSYYANVFNSESTGNLPKIEIYHRDDYDIDPDLDIEQFDNELRVYSKQDDDFEAVSMDGIAKPDSEISFDLYEKVSEDTFDYVKTEEALEVASRYYIDPIYSSNPLENVQTYEKGEVNYTTDYIRMGAIPKYDTYYEYRMKVTNNGVTSSKEFITDGFIIYQVKLGDNLQSIANYYGLSVDDIKKDSNLTTNKVIEDDVLFLRFPKDNPKVPKDVYQPPVRLSTYTAKYVYRGPSCYGSCAVGDPINTSIGNFYHESNDFTMQDFDTLGLTRTYNSYGEDMSSIFGMNFSSNLEQSIAYDKEDNLYFFRGDGKIIQIEKSNGSYVPRAVDKLEVTLNDSTISIYDIREEVTYVFNDYGMLTKIVTKNGYESVIQYNEDGWISGIQFGDKEATIEYNDYNLVSQINLPNNTTIRYVYNSERQLVEFIDANGNSEHYTYGEFGKIKNITDKNGNVLANNTYDTHGAHGQDGVVLSQMDANGNKVEFEYDDNTTTVIYQGNERESYSLDEDYKVTKITMGDGSSTTYEYDQDGRMIQETNELSEMTTYTHNDQGYLIKKVNPDGTSISYSYDSNHNITQVINEDDTIDNYQFDERNNLIYKSLSGQPSMWFEYDDQNRVIKETDALGVSKSYEYSGNLITKVTHSNGLVESYFYDVMGNLVKESDNQDRSTSYVYDNLNQVIKKTDSYGLSEEYKYDGNGNVIETIDKLGGKTIYEYDGNNNLVTTSKGELKTTQTYDYRNRVIEEINEQGLVTKSEYNTKGLLVKSTDAYGNATLYEYDEVGHLIKTTDTKGNVNAYDYVGELLVKEINAKGQVTLYEYDTHGAHGEYHRNIKTTLPNGQTILNTYDDNGNVIKVIDERGLETLNEYDEYNRLVKEVSATGVVTTYEYDVYNQLIKKTEDEKVTTYTYDVYGNALKETNVYGDTKTFEFDKLNRLVKETDELGYSTQYTYNGLDEVIETVDALGNISQRLYDVNGILVQEIDQLGNTLMYDYNSLGYVVAVVDAYENKTTYTYDDDGNMIETKVNDIIVLKNGYDDYGRLIKEDKLNEVISYTYDSFDQVVEVKNETTGLTISNSYDDYGNVMKEEDNGGKVTTYEYDIYNQTIKINDAYGRESTNEYDAYGRLVESIDFTNQKTVQDYDKQGNVAKTTDYFGNTTSYQYDLLNRVVKKITNHDERIYSYSYDAKGQLVTTYDSYSNATDETKYDALGQVIETMDQLGNVTKKEYDALGQVSKTTDANDNSTTYEYDLYGNVIKETDALGNSKQWKYNEFGLLIQEVDKRGFSVTYQYNEKFQLVEVIDKLGNSVKAEYNEQGYLSKETNQNGFTTRYEYDLYGQIIKEINPNGNVTTTVYNVLGNVVEVTIPNKKTIHTYDALGRLVSTLENDVVKVENSYNELNQVISSKNALGYETIYLYDQYGQVASETYLERISEYSYDLNGNVVALIENGVKTTTYEYDVLNREVSQRTNDVLQSTRTYDAVGNVVAETNLGVTIQSTYDAIGRLKETLYPTVVENDTEFVVVTTLDYDEEGNQIKATDYYGYAYHYGYDGNGNVISETNTNGYTTKYEYDSLGNLVKLQTPLERVVKYTYDGNNNQITKAINDKKAKYTYDENDHLIKEESEYGLVELYQYDSFDNLVQLTKNDGTVIKYNYDALGNKLSEGSRSYEYDAYNQLVTASVNGNDTDYEYDLFGNTIKVTDPYRQVVEYEYDVFGNQIKQSYSDIEVSYIYDQNNQLIRVLKDGEAYGSYEYDARGNVTVYEVEDIRSEYRYDELNRKIDYLNYQGDKVISTYQYSFDGEGNILSETINGLMNQYAYNESNELENSVKYIDGEVVETTYHYDWYGNKIEKNNNGVTKTYTYNDKNQLVTIKDSELGMHDLYYDKNGNIQDIYYEGGYREHYEYDEFDQLITLQTNRERTWMYEYDAEGDRLYEEKVLKDTSLEGNSKFDTDEWYTDYLQSLTFEEAKALLEERNTEETFDSLRAQITYRTEHGGLCAVGYNQEIDNKEEEYSHYYVLDKTIDNAVVLATEETVNIYSDGAELMSSNGDIYIHGLNESVYAIVSGDKVTEITYNDSGYSDDLVSGFGYNAELLDESGNIYLRARYYNPRIGQFIQVDSNRGSSTSLESQNRYLYGLNNPYRYVDRDGNFILTLSNIIIAGVAAITAVYLLSPSGKKATRDAAEAIVGITASTLKAVGTGVKKVANNLTATLDITNPNNLVNWSVGGAVVATVIKLTSNDSRTLDFPNGCPEFPFNIDWDSLSSSLRQMIIELGMYQYVIYALTSAFILNVYNHDKENHHIVPKGLNHKLELTGKTLNDARKELEKSKIDYTTDTRNIVRIQTALHKTTLGSAYKDFICLSFPNNDYVLPSATILKLSSIKKVFRSLDNILFPTNKVPVTHKYY